MASVALPAALLGADLELEGGELLVVCGETASGKTALAVALARALDGEIVGADSVQVYRGFDIGSGKPTAEELDGVPHHLLSVADPAEEFHAGRFVALADAAIAEVRGRGRLPIVCGGTYLWIKALVEGLVEAPPASPSLRAELHAELAERGAAHLHARLRGVDPASAERLHPNDAVRVVRALEVHALTGTPLSTLHAAHGFRTRRLAARLLRVERPREQLERRIAARVGEMLARGLVDEVRGLLSAGHGACKAMRSVGYAETKAHLEGTLPLAELAPAIVRSTCVFARRQRTWLARAAATVVTSPSSAPSP
ncbi:MAG: tRNA (adenosine(37)-N6)-dimethylallyltransferase MiaA [Myxococcales bacterium]|nr:tRNA (adenosine(37)-N6)-dimethylallyltransferase MiaA [Myxococcales bacterium]